MSNVYVVLSIYPEFRATPSFSCCRFFATHSNQWNCFILYRSWITSNGFFRAKAGQKAGFRVMLKYFEIKKAFRYYIKQIDSMLPCLWFSNRSQKTSKCGKNISDTLGYASCATFLFLPHLNVICDLLLNRRTATWNLFVKQLPSSTDDI